jgi:hypothetical protein
VNRSLLQNHIRPPRLVRDSEDTPPFQLIHYGQSSRRCRSPHFMPVRGIIKPKLKRHDHCIRPKLHLHGASLALNTPDSFETTRRPQRLHLPMYPTCRVFSTCIGGQSFAFLPHRFLRDSFLPSLTPDKLRLYVFLIPATDRNDISFYPVQRIRCALEMPINDYIKAR